MLDPEHDDPKNVYPLNGHSPRRWHHLRRSDLLFLLGLGITIAMFVKWYTTGTSPDPLWLGMSVYWTTASVALPRVLTWLSDD